MRLTWARPSHGDCGVGQGRGAFLFLKRNPRVRKESLCPRQIRTATWVLLKGNSFFPMALAPKKSLVYFAKSLVRKSVNSRCIVCSKDIWVATETAVALSQGAKGGIAILSRVLYPANWSPFFFQGSCSLCCSSRFFLVLLTKMAFIEVLHRPWKYDIINNKILNNLRKCPKI